MEGVDWGSGAAAIVGSHPNFNPGPKVGPVYIHTVEPLY